MRGLFVLTGLAFGLGACVSGAAHDTRPVTPPPPSPVAVAPPSAIVARRPSFAVWLAAFKEDAIAAGVSQQTADRALDGIQLIPRVIELDHRQPEVKLTFDQYITRIVNDTRVADAQRHLIEDHDLLTEVSQRYGVEPRFIVALWGMETDFGAETGGFPIIPALATLAYDGRRAALFRRELIAALEIIDRFELPPEKLRGSWAGAMGQSQFMPSSFLAYAVDYSGDGTPDIWSNKADVFASIANYLAKAGWDSANGWGVEVTLPPVFDPSLIANLSGTVEKTGPDWTALGVRAADGGDLPAFQGDLRLVQPGGVAGPTLLVTDNYRVLLKWNRSLYFATAVSDLADRIAN